MEGEEHNSKEHGEMAAESNAMDTSISAEDQEQSSSKLKEENGAGAGPVCDHSECPPFQMSASVPPFADHLSMFCSVQREGACDFPSLPCKEPSRPFDELMMWDDTRLSSGMTFKGTQTNDGAVFQVVVDIRDVSFADGVVCGYLKVEGISDTIRTLNTFFTGEIIGNHHSFHTGKWGTNSNVDKKHWRKFKHFESYVPDFNEDTIDYKSIEYNQCVFMRWKELFLVEDSSATSVPGASFAGFYYVCYDCADRSINGFYYYKESDWFQKIELTNIDSRPRRSYEFR